MQKPKVTTADCVQAIVAKWPNAKASEWKRIRKLKLSKDDDGAEVRVFNNTKTGKHATVLCEFEYTYDKQPIKPTWTDMSPPGSNLRIIAEGPSHKQVNRRYEPTFTVYKGNLFPKPDAAVVAALLAAAKPLPKDNDDYGPDLYWMQRKNKLMITAGDGYGGDDCSRGRQIMDEVDAALYAAGAAIITWEAEYTPLPDADDKKSWGYEHIGRVGTVYYDYDDEDASERFWYHCVDDEDEDEECEEDTKPAAEKPKQEPSSEFPDDWDAIQKLPKRI